MGDVQISYKEFECPQIWVSVGPLAVFYADIKG